MSLLLDALRRAEQEKRARQEPGAAPAPTAPVALAPAEPPADPAARPATLELEMVEAKAPQASAPVRSATAAQASAGASAPARAGAKAVFAAKQAPSEASPRRRAMLLAAGAAVFLAVAGGGGFYVWQQVNALTPKPILARATPAPKPVIPAPPAESPAPADAPAADAGRKSAPASEARKGAQGTEALLAGLLRESAATPPPAPLKLTRSLETPHVMREVASGYDRLQRGDLAGARAAYQSAIGIDPASVDAELGLATVAARTGDRAVAGRHYRRALELDPRNASAAAGLAAISDFASPGAVESMLRNELARSPDNAALHFTLGNLYASQARWAEAQGAFFEAHRLDPANADILYNLAVSLDNLGQARLAADFYRQALAAARGRAHQFDASPVSRRLAELTP